MDLDRLNELKDLTDQAQVTADIAREMSISADKEVREAQEKLRKAYDEEEVTIDELQRTRNALHAEMTAQHVVLMADGSFHSTQVTDAVR